MAMGSMNQELKDYAVEELSGNRELLDILDSDPDRALEIIKGLLRGKKKKHFPGVQINLGHDAVSILNTLREKVSNK